MSAATVNGYDEEDALFFLSRFVLCRVSWAVGTAAMVWRRRTCVKGYDTAASQF